MTRLSSLCATSVWLLANCLLACTPEKPPLALGVKQPTNVHFADSSEHERGNVTEQGAANAAEIGVPALATITPAMAAPRAAASAHSAPDVDVVLHRPSLEATTALSTADAKPVLNAELLRLRHEAQTRILGKNTYFEDAFGNPPPARPANSRRNGFTLGTFVPVENEKSLEHFHEHIERLATGRDQDGKVRILAYGASHTQGDLFTSYLRYYLQSRFGNGGLGFVPLAKLNDWHRMLDASIEENGFITQHSQRNTPPHGYLGLLGAAATGSARAAAARVVPKNNTDAYLSATDYELSYAADRNGGDLHLFVNEVPRIQLGGRASGPEDRFFKFKMAPGWHQVEVRPAGNGPTRVYGVTIERPEPGVVVDTLGIGGARASSILTWDEQAWALQVQRRDPALYILAYGTNESIGARASIQQYREQLGEVLARFARALPHASCLLVGPFDFPQETPQGYMTRAKLLEVIETQRAVAREHGCGFWDGYRFMGGPGSMREWVRAEPSLASPDHIHLNARGYVRMGMALSDAIMRAYDEFHLVDTETPSAPTPAADPALNAALGYPDADEQHQSEALVDLGSSVGRGLPSIRRRN